MIKNLFKTLLLLMVVICSLPEASAQCAFDTICTYTTLPYPDSDSISRTPGVFVLNGYVTATADSQTLLYDVNGCTTEIFVLQSPSSVGGMYFVETEGAVNVNLGSIPGSDPSWEYRFWHIPNVDVNVIQGTNAGSGAMIDDNLSLVNQSKIAAIQKYEFQIKTESCTSQQYAVYVVVVNDNFAIPQKPMPQKHEDEERLIIRDPWSRKRDNEIDYIEANKLLIKEEKGKQIKIIRRE